MSTAKQLVFVSLALFCLEGIHVCSGNSTAVYVPCKGGLNRLLQLEEMIHISDVVVNGVVSTGTIRQDEFGTFSASVSYYFAYKNDRLLARRGLASVNVVNFQERPGGESSFFFLVRQPNTELSLYCMSPLSQLDKSHEALYSSLYEVVEKVKEIAADDVEKNKHFVPPYPNPCDSASSDAQGCSSTGSYCTVMNTLSNETSRCTCLTGFQGDGFVCTPRAEAAAKMNCPQCKHGARCITTEVPDHQGNNIISDGEVDEETYVTVTKVLRCSCDHFVCRGQAARVLCATDGITYSNECHMRREACRLQKDIYKVHNGECQSQSVQPCGGMNLPLSTSAGLVNCSGTINCPPMHFCHSTDIFDVCCPVTAPTATTQRPISIETTKPPPITTPSSGSGSGDAGDQEEHSGDGAEVGSGEDSNEMYDNYYDNYFNII